MQEMGAKTVMAGSPITNYDIVPYQTTHNTGGTIMGASPDDSVVNNYLQHWNADNLFVVGAGYFAITVDIILQELLVRLHTELQKELLNTVRLAVHLFNSK